MSVQTAFSLVGQNALIHCPDSIYGLEIAAGLCEVGANVWFCGPDEQALLKTKAKLEDMGCLLSGYFLYKAGTKEAADHLVHQIQAAMESLDVYVENGTNQLPSGWQHDFETIDSVLQRTQLGLILTIQAIGLLLSERHSGSVILISDYAALVGCDVQLYDQTGDHFEQDFSLFYGFVKGSLVNYVRQAAGFLGEHQVRCNTLAFAPLSETVPADFEQAYIRHTHLKRLISAEDIKAAAVFFASDASSYITGVTLPVDGGYTAK